MALVSGATNVGGLFALGHFASHMTGYLTLLADGLFVMDLSILLFSLMSLGLFVLGGVTCTLLVIWLNRRARALRYAVPVAIQGGLLWIFAVTGLLPEGVGTVLGLGVLCFTMGLQNAMITKISKAQIRTTHMTGLVTDLSIEAGRALSLQLMPGRGTPPNMVKLRILGQIVALFLLGGILGSFLFSLLGFAFSAPIGAVLLILSMPVLLRAVPICGSDER